MKLSIQLLALETALFACGALAIPSAKIETPDDKDASHYSSSCGTFCGPKFGLGCDCAGINPNTTPTAPTTPTIKFSLQLLCLAATLFANGAFAVPAADADALLDRRQGTCNHSCNNDPELGNPNCSCAGHYCNGYICVHN
ncbi:hypothetical protein TI39_contig606g00018 [Zymoseptoria brevis]|uniref:Uncharacterized protein n=1 Tax=Zymoseptoria brevis TaxID=1047168 RepID=A0A0F4GI25_9PEZI|nr:hypothetical protein TI39_contig606g00018 [Zymoseptoria brevis]